MTRWPIIRHIRYFYYAWRFNVWWRSVGHALGAFPNEADLAYLDAIWRGEQ